MQEIEEIRDLRAEDRSNKDSIRTLNRNQRASFQKYGLVKYNAFKGMGGNLSFVVAMLDGDNTGFVLDVVHSREGCYIYLKQVEKGATEVLLGSEEQAALEQALGYEKKPILSRLSAKRAAVPEELPDTEQDGEMEPEDTADDVWENEKGE